MTADSVARPAGGSALVTLTNVHKEYDLGKTTVVALREITLSIQKGFFAAIAGAQVFSGCFGDGRRRRARE